MEAQTPSKGTKDIFMFSPIFESPEKVCVTDAADILAVLQAVRVGLGCLEQSLEEGKSKRSSLTSLVWDDECDFTAPYQVNIALHPPLTFLLCR